MDELKLDIGLSISNYFLNKYCEDICHQAFVDISHKITDSLESINEILDDTNIDLRETVKAYEKESIRAIKDDIKTQEYLEENL